MKLPLQSLLRFWPHAPSPSPALPQATPRDEPGVDARGWRRIIGLLLLPILRWRARRIARVLAVLLRPGEALLYAGRRDDLLTRALIQASACCITGAEVSELAEAATARLTRAGDWSSISDDSFDTVLADLTRRPPERLEAAVRECRRVARGRVILLVDEPSRPRRGELRAALRESGGGMQLRMERSFPPVPLLSHRKLLVAFDKAPGGGGNAPRCSARTQALDAERAGRMARFFDRKALGYDGPVLRMLGRAELAALEKLLPGKCAALDYGCGAGRFSLPLAQRGYDVTGFDTCPQMVAGARLRGDRQGVKACFTADRETLRGKTWPLVVCMGVLDYYRDPALLLEQVAPCVAPGGRLIVAAPNVYGPLSWAHSLFLAFSIRMYMFRGRDIAEAGKRFGLTVSSTTFALPAMRPIGMTVLVAFDRAV